MFIMAILLSIPESWFLEDMLATLKWDIKYIVDPDEIPHNIWSGSTVFSFNTEILIYSMKLK